MDNLIVVCVIFFINALRFCAEHEKKAKIATKLANEDTWQARHATMRNMEMVAWSAQKSGRQAHIFNSKQRTSVGIYATSIWLAFWRPLIVK